MSAERVLNVSTLIIDKLTPDAQPYVLTVGGKVYDKDGTLYIMYTENDPEQGSVKVRITVKDACVEIRRESAQTRYILEFQKGVETQAKYYTPYGIIPLTIKTRKIGADRGTDGLTPKISLSYELFSDEQFVGDYFVKIEAMPYNNI